MKHEIIRVTLIILTFIIGWGLTIAGFIAPPLGEVDNSILVILGQALSFVAIGIGMKDYVDVSINKLKG